MSSSQSAIEQLREWQRRIDALPPAPYAFMAHHSVPYGKVFRQWDTRGRLLVWINRGQVADLPRAHDSWGIEHARPARLFGTPVIVP